LTSFHVFSFFFFHFSSFFPFLSVILISLPFRLCFCVLLPRARVCVCVCVCVYVFVCVCVCVCVQGFISDNKWQKTRKQNKLCGVKCDKGSLLWLHPHSFQHVNFFTFSVDDCKNRDEVSFKFKFKFKNCIVQLEIHFKWKFFFCSTVIRTVIYFQTLRTYFNWKYKEKLNTRLEFCKQQKVLSRMSCVLPFCF
jgi:hypothetical protein